MLRIRSLLFRFCGARRMGSGQRAPSPHRDVRVAELRPAIEVQEAVDAADLAPHEPLPLGQVQGVSSVEIIDGSHHGEVCRDGRGQDISLRTGVLASQPGPCPAFL